MRLPRFVWVTPLLFQGCVCCPCGQGNTQPPQQQQNHGGCEATFSPWVEPDGSDEGATPTPVEPPDAGYDAGSDSEADATTGADASEADARVPMDGQDAQSDVTTVDAGLENDAAADAESDAEE